VPDGLIKAIFGDRADTFTKTERFTIQEVEAHHGVVWADLDETDRMSMAEDYALWFFYRRHGDMRDIRVDAELPEEG
jgi:hypothetical protein